MNPDKPISKNERALVLVSNLVSHGRSDLKRLYRFIELSGVAHAGSILGPRYETYRQLVREQATSKAFIDSLAS